MQNDREVLRWLFETEAFRPSPPDEAFWYTSGTFGPYYINTHFLFGSETEAKELLDAIDRARECPLALPRLIGKRCMQQYWSNEMYQSLIDKMAEQVKDLPFDYISGGERRDFFFSFPLAEKLGKEHISIMKDGRAYLSTQGFASVHELKKDELSGAKVLHVADLVTEASSYFRCWLPSIYGIGAEITDTFAVVDRQQGGRENLEQHHINLHCFVQIAEPFFREAFEEGKLTEAKMEELLLFTKSPENYRKAFLEAHPGFLDEEEKKDAKRAERVALYRKRLKEEA